MTDAIDVSAAVSAEQWRSTLEQLFAEAQLLDNGRFTDWLELLADPFEYRVLNRVTREREHRKDAFVPTNFHVLCDRSAMETRIARLDSEYAWSEDTPTVTRRFVSNVRVNRRRANRLSVQSYLLLFRARWDTSAFLVAERKDEWVDLDGKLLLSSRWVYIDHSVLPIDNLGLIL